MATKTWNGSDGSFSLDGNWSPQAAPVSGDTAIITAGTVTAAGTLPGSLVIALTASNASSPELILSDATLVSSSQLNLTAGGSNATLRVRGAVTNQGTIAATGTSPGAALLRIDDTLAGGATTLLNTGSILVSGTAFQVVTFGANADNRLQNDGLISILSPDQTPQLAYVGVNLTGTGTVLLGIGVTFEAARAVSASQTFVFDRGVSGATTLLMDAGTQFNAIIDGFASSDTIQLFSPRWDAASYASTGASSGVLTLSLNGVISKTIAFQGSYTRDSFTLQQSAQTGSSQARTTITTTVAEIRPSTYAIVAADADKPDGTRVTTPYTFIVTRTGDASKGATLSYAVVGSGSNPAPSYLFSQANGTVSFAPGASSATITLTVNPAAIRTAQTFDVTLSGVGATAAGVIQPNVTAPLGARDIALTGMHDQYVIAATHEGQVYIQDTVAGRDGTRTIANPGELRFADGTGLFDPTGNAEAVTRLYQAAFNRAPDAPGIEYSTALINAGSISLAKVADGFITSDEFNRAYGNPDTRTFVTSLYQNILHRAVNPSDPLDVRGVQNFSNLADSQGRGAALLAMSDSQENHRRTLPISGDRIDAETTRLYQAAFNRAPDAAGFDVMQNALRSGVPADTLAEGFVASGEFQRAYGSMSSRDFVAQLYRNVLHREADQGGLDQYTRALDANYSRGYALASIADSTENRVLTAGATHDAWVFLG